jgi:hypothetical protein
MEEQFLNDLGQFLVDLIRLEIDNPNRQRFTKKFRLPKSPSKYKVNATGKLSRSVSYVVRDNEIDILMEDYGVNNVFNPTEAGGSFPGRGRYYPDMRTAGQKQSKSALITSLTTWAEEKFKVSPAKAKGIAFAVRKNLFKFGYGGIPLFTEEFQFKVVDKADELLQTPQYLNALTNEFVDGILDKINLFGTQDYNLLFGDQ